MIASPYEDPQTARELMEQDMDMLGHNLPPSPADPFAPDVDTLICDCDEWAAKPVNEDTAPAIRDLIARATKLRKEMEEARRREKKPFEERAKAVDEAFKPLAEKVQRAETDQKARLQAWMVAEEARRRAEAIEAAKRAEDERRRAEEAARKAANPFDEMDAAEAAKAARMAEIDAQHKAQMAQSAPSVSSAAGFTRAAGLRTTYHGEVTDGRALVTHFADHPDVIAAALKVANAVIRSSKGAVNIPGVEIKEDRRVA